MTPEQFTYWLNGFAELNQTAPTAEQWKSIQEHLALVFNKVTSPVEKRNEFKDSYQKGMTNMPVIRGVPYFANNEQHRPGEIIITC